MSSFVVASVGNGIGDLAKTATETPWAIVWMIAAGLLFVIATRVLLQKSRGQQRPASINAESEPSSAEDQADEPFPGDLPAGESTSPTPELVEPSADESPVNEVVLNEEPVSVGQPSSHASEALDVADTTDIIRLDISEDEQRVPPHHERVHHHH